MASPIDSNPAEPWVTARDLAVLVAVLGLLAYVVPIAVYFIMVGTHPFSASVTFTEASLWALLRVLVVLAAGAVGVGSALLSRPLLGWMVALAFAALAVREPIWWFYLMASLYALAALLTTFRRRGRSRHLPSS